MQLTDRCIGKGKGVGKQRANHVKNVSSTERSNQKTSPTRKNMKSMAQGAACRRQKESYVEDDRERASSQFGRVLLRGDSQHQPRTFTVLFLYSAVNVETNTPEVFCTRIAYDEKHFR
jgi:hypothetical protein